MNGRTRLPVTIEMIAAEAGVSKTTVAFVLENNPTISESTRAKVLRIVKDLGYHSSISALDYSSVRHSRSICVLVPEVGRLFKDPYFSHALDGIYDQLEAADYPITIRKASLAFIREKEYLNLFRRSEIAGMIYVGSTLSDTYLEDFAGSRYPFVLVDSRMPGLPLTNVRADNVMAGRLMTRHLIKLGHRRIATITGGLNTTSATERLEGYKAALVEARIPFEEDLVRPGEFDPLKAAEEALRLYKREDRPTAIYVGNDVMAIGVLEAMEREKIRIPDDLAIVGTDNIELAGYCRPSLTTVDTDTFNVARTAARRLLELVEGDQGASGQYRTMPVCAVIRLSCGFKQESPPTNSARTDTTWNMVAAKTPSQESNRGAMSNDALKNLHEKRIDQAEDKNDR